MLRLPRTQAQQQARRHVIRGRIGAAPKATPIAPYSASPGPLEAPPPPTSHGTAVAEIASRLLLAYTLRTGGTNSKGARDPSRQARKQIEAVAERLLAAGRSPEGYIEYVCTRYATRRGRSPMLAEVVGPAAFKGWLPEYAGNALQVLPIPTYTASEENRGRWYARYAAAEEVIERVWIKHQPNKPFPKRRAAKPVKRASS